MTQNYLCISIPEELQEFTKEVTLINNNEDDKSGDFGVKPILDKYGNMTGTSYYSNSGELIKKIFYKGSSVESIQHYRNNKLYSEEKFITGKISRKTLYNSEGKELSVIKYKYDREDRIVCIQKRIDGQFYSVEYGYDELKRVNSRIIRAGSEVINEQKYRYDILDRIVEYQDSNQCINVHKVNQYNELLNYTITDIIGNRIVVSNRFMCSEYIGTDIELNGHKTSVCDRIYVNNVMLKKPYTNEDDLDFALSNMIKVPKISSTTIMTTKRENNINTDKISNFIISNKREKDSTPPLSADKIKLLKL